MSARFTPKDIHPSIFEEVLRVTGGYMAGSLTDQKSLAAATKHSSVWFAEYGKGFVVWLLGLIPVIYGTALVRAQFGKPGTVLFFLAALGIWMLIGGWALKKNKGLLTWEELAAIRSGLNLDEHQELYLDCLQCVEESKILDSSQKRSWREALYHTLDQAMTLKRLANDMTTSSGGLHQIEGMVEVQRLEGLANRTADPLARQAYEESLQLAKDRMSKWDGVASQAERTEAHLELTKQTLLKTRDTLRAQQFDQQKTVQVDLEPLRANLSRVQTDAYEIQRAIEELRQI